MNDKKTFLEDFLRELESERDKLNITIETIRNRLGLFPIQEQNTEKQQIDNMAAQKRKSSGFVPLPNTIKMREMIIDILEQHGKTKTSDIANIMLQRGFDFEGKNPSLEITAALRRFKNVDRVSRATWEIKKEKTNDKLENNIDNKTTEG